jgi:hypothetical protein
MRKRTHRQNIEDGVAPSEREQAEPVRMEERMTKKNDKAMDRRNFFRAVGGASTVAVAAVAAPIAATEAQAYDPGGDEARARYQPDAADVKAFYRTNGYETLKK